MIASRRSLLLLLAAASASLAACGQSSPPAATAATPAPSATATPASDTAPSGGTGTALVAFIKDSPRTYVIAPAEQGKGLGRTQVTVDGTHLWPPSGAECAELIRCCTELASAAATAQFDLGCQLAIARDASCKDARTTVRAMLREQSLAAPASCAP